ncbi:hypothetical protein [Clostridium perfringens]|uniref:hypothetical protein n=1 Tax=Clostridium perfringens TaxID=1502 RepID=UPI0024BD5C66|nr:hypothetical protein [Clostridium perfringens]
MWSIEKQYFVLCTLEQKNNEYSIEEDIAVFEGAGNDLISRIENFICNYFDIDKSQLHDVTEALRVEDNNICRCYELPSNEEIQNPKHIAIQNIH